MSRGILVVGTDTGVGKTRVACELLRAHVRGGLRAVGMKPVATGLADGATVNDDVIALAAAGNVDSPLELRNPYSFSPAIAPHLAAAAANTRIDLDRIRAAYDALTCRADRVVVEAAGGVFTPLDDHSDMLDIARVLGVPVLLVVGLRLGCINHALLSAQAIAARGLVLDGWLPNRVDPSFAQIDENIASLERRIPARRLPLMAWLPD